MGGAGGEPSGRRHAHRVVIHSSPCGAADKSRGRQGRWQLTCRGLLGDNVCLSGRRGVESSVFAPSD